jgi:hypothetical protein
MALIICGAGETVAFVGRLANLYRVPVEFWSLDTCKRHACTVRQTHVVELAHMDALAPVIEQAARIMGRDSTRLNAYTHQLLCRCAAMAYDVDVLIAVAPLLNTDAPSRLMHCGLPGTIGWTVQMFANHAYTDRLDQRLYLYSQSARAWYKAVHNTDTHRITWVPVEARVPAAMAATAARVGFAGPRHMNAQGKVAMGDVLQGMSRVVK